LSIGQTGQEGFTDPPSGMRVIMTAIQHSQGHMGQLIDEAFENDTAVNTSEGSLRSCAKVKYLRSENAVLRQQLKDLEEMRNCHDLSIPMKSDDTWSHQVKSYTTTILFAQVKFILSEKFLDDLTNLYSLGNKTAHLFKIENKVSSFWMTYKQDVAFGIKRKRGNVRECITKDFKSKCIVNCSSLLFKYLY
jgi:hypothetical protein